MLFSVLLCFAPAVSQAEAAVKITYAKEGEVQAMFLKKGPILYPYEARHSRRSGSGIFRIYIRPDGKVKSVGVVKSTGHSDLDLAASGGLYRCLFKPGGRRELDLPVAFTLSRPIRP
jgi:TonB family protein